MKPGTRKSQIPLNFLPVVVRELMVAARLPSTYRSRFWAVSAALAVSFAIVIMGGSPSGGGGGSGQQGIILFSGLSLLAFGYCLIVGARVTADCLSVEKRDGTLGLLFLTDLSGLDVVFGKLAATSLRSVYGLIALVPILAIPLQMGGVSGIVFLKVVLCLLNALFLSLATGIFVSSRSMHDRKAMTTALLVVACVALGPYVFLIYVETLEGTSMELLRWLAWPLLLFSPVSPFLMTSMVTFGATGTGMMVQVTQGTSEILFFASITMSHVSAWVLLLLAASSLVGYARNRPSINWIQRCRDAFQQFLYGNRERRLAHRRELLDMNAFSWLTSRERFKSRYVWIFLASLVVIYVVNFTRQGDVTFDFQVLAPLGFVVHAFLKIWVASEACHRIAEDRRLGALELLLATPLGPREIVRGQFLALWRQFFLPLVVLFGLELVIIFGYAAEARGVTHFQVRALYLGAAILLLVDCAIIGWVAMWHAVDKGSTNRAVAQTVFTFLVIPWGLYALGVTVIEAARVTFAADGFIGLDLRWLGRDTYLFEFPWRKLSTAGKVIVWGTIGVVFDILLGLCWARPNLLRQFRERVAAGVPRAT